MVFRKHKGYKQDEFTRTDSIRFGRHRTTKMF